MSYHRCIIHFCANAVWDQFEYGSLCRKHMLTVWVQIEQWRRESGDDAEKIVTDANGEWRIGKYTDEVEPPAAVTGTLYLVRVGDKVKAGFSTQIRQRLRAYPPDSVVMGVAYGKTKADEKALHGRLAQFRIAGREWYRPDPEIDDIAAEMVAEHGRPPQVKWGKAYREVKANLPPVPFGATQPHQMQRSNPVGVLPSERSEAYARAFDPLNWIEGDPPKSA